MTTADSPPAAAWSLGYPNHRLVVNAIWAGGLAAVVWAATVAEQPNPRRTARRSPVPWSAYLGVFATVVLLVRPFDALYVTIPAVITLLLAQARLVVSLRDARGKAEAQRLSLTDDLTHLPNRRAVIQHLSRAVERNERVGVLLLDLDGFKDVNDTYGHGAGDELLRSASQRLRRAAPDDVLVARLGGDEFAMLVPQPQEELLIELGETMLNALRVTNPDIASLPIAGSIGVAINGSADSSPDDVLRRADVAMYHAKDAGGGVAVYDPTTDPFSEERHAVAEALQIALRDGAIETWYQPQADARTGAVVGVEALARWRRPSGEVLLPAQFLPIARRAGLMNDLSRTIASQAVADICALHAAGHRVRLSLNVDPAQLLSGSFVPFLLELIDAAGLPAGTVTVEVTEESFLGDAPKVQQTLADLARHGITVSIDDYGTGFSSLAYLRDLPVGELKIDRSFVRDVATDERSRIIVASTATMARGLAMRLVAEGVADEPGAQMLRDLGVDAMQGFHVSAPRPRAALIAWLDARRFQTTGTSV